MVWFGQKWTIHEKMPNFQRPVSPTSHMYFVNVSSSWGQVSIALWEGKIKFLYSWVLGVKTADLELSIFGLCSSNRQRPLVTKAMNQSSSGLMSRQLLLFKAIDFVYPFRSYGIIWVFARHILKSTKWTIICSNGPNKVVIQFLMFRALHRPIILEKKSKVGGTVHFCAF